jgi:type I restriction enzyme M protein
VQNEETRDPAYPSQDTSAVADRKERNRSTRGCTPAISKRKRRARLIFGKAQNEFQDAAKVRRVTVDLIDRENWPKSRRTLQ